MKKSFTLFFLFTIFALTVFSQSLSFTPDITISSDEEIFAMGAGAKQSMPLMIILPRDYCSILPLIQNILAFSQQLPLGKMAFMLQILQTLPMERFLIHILHLTKVL